MATLGLLEEELKTVEQLVARLSQLSSGIQSFKMDVLKSNPLPPVSSLQASAQILQRNLQTCLETISENRGLFDRMAVHPSTNYPGRTQENVLTQILRKKLEPEVEELVGKGRDTADAVTPEGIAQLRSVWSELREWTHTRIAEYVREEAGDVYTREERDMGVENVRTGLRRDLEEDEDEEADDDDDDEETSGDGVGADGGVGGGQTKRKSSAQVAEDQVMGGTDEARWHTARGPEPETLLWFAARGDFQVAANVEYERKVGAYRGTQGVRVPVLPSTQHAGVS